MKRHHTDTLSLVFGLAFATVGLVLLAGGDGALSLGWVAPLAAVVLGVLLMFAARSTDSEPSAQPPED
jgi:hypothetical protein